MNISKIHPAFLSLLLSLCAASASAAAFSPLQIGIAGENLQLVDSHTPVIGLRLNLPVSDNETVGGLDIGLGSNVENFSGIRLNLSSWAGKAVRGIDVSLIGIGGDESEFDGIQIAGICAASQMRGLQAGIVSYAATLRGLQIGLWSAACDLCGLQIGLANFAESPRGIQLGIFNASDMPPQTCGTVHGVQIGLVNLAATLHGVQIGLLNIVPDSDYPCLPFLRASF